MRFSQILCLSYITQGTAKSFTPNIKALCLVFQKKKIFKDFLFISPRKVVIHGAGLTLVPGPETEQCFKGLKRTT